MEEYGQEYYERCRAKGIDYAFYGNWQKQYAKLVVFMTDLYMLDYRNKSMLDIGCACGVNLVAFKETNIFDNYYGIDVSEYLINLGKEKFRFTDKELIVGKSEELPFDDNSMDFIHCSQLFEHLSIHQIDQSMSEMQRVLKKRCKLFLTLNAVKAGQSPRDVYKQDKSHVTAKRENWWEKYLSGYFEIQDYNEVQRKWIKGKFYPGDENDIDPNKEGENKRRTFYDHYKEDWSTFILIKR